MVAQDYTQLLQDIELGHIIAKSSASASTPFVPNHNLTSVPASATDYEQQSSPPNKTINPNVLRPPSYPNPQERDPRSVVADYVRSSAWLGEDTMEPEVGTGYPGIPECASQLVMPGCSIFKCFIIRVKQRGATMYKCVDCNHIVDRIDRALEHQRSKRDHKPFVCPKEWRVEPSIFRSSNTQTY